MPFRDAEWIGGGRMLRRRFVCAAAAAAAGARLRISGLGCFVARLNGKRVGDDELVPAQSNYETLVYYLEYDLDGLLRRGENERVVQLGEGCYGPALVVAQHGWADAPYGERRMIAEIPGLVASDASWECADGPWVSDNVYAGEVFDARIVPEWRPARPMPPPGGRLRLQPIAGECVVRSWEAAAVAPGAEGSWIFDFGVNLSGRARLKVEAPAGTRIEMRYAEEFDEETGIDFDSTGYFATGYIPTDVYICAGTGVEEWSPAFGYRGFRYIELKGFPGVPAAADLRAEEIRSRLETTGEFTCSDPLVNRIWGMAERTLAGNLHSLPTDCPAREKCGWLGDAQVIGYWSCFRYGMADFWRKYCSDIATSAGRGIPPMVAPGSRRCGEATPAWGIACIVIPYVHYCFYGDAAILREHYALMKRWLRHLKRNSKKGIVEYGLGDWCPPGSIKPNNSVPVPLTSTAMFYQSADTLARIARILGHAEDEAEFRRLAGGIREAFFEKFYDPEFGSFGSQTGNVLALQFGLAPEEIAADVAAVLHHELSERRGHFSTGILGLKYLCEVLCRYGYADDALSIFHAPGYPGFRDLIRQGATTLWETWEKYPVDSLADPRSRNHPMQSGYASFFFRNLGGLMVDEEFGAGARLVYEPSLPAGLDSARVEFRSRHGRIVSSWRREARGVRLELTLPQGLECDFRRNATTADAELVISTD